MRAPGASAVIYGGLEETAIAFEGVDEALRVRGVDIRLFGKPESFTRRRMGVVLAKGADVAPARARAQEAAAKIRQVPHHRRRARADQRNPAANFLKWRSRVLLRCDWRHTRRLHPRRGGAEARLDLGN